MSSRLRAPALNRTQGRIGFQPTDQSFGIVAPSLALCRRSYTRHQESEEHGPKSRRNCASAWRSIIGSVFAAYAPHFAGSDWFRRDELLIAGQLIAANVTRSRRGCVHGRVNDLRQFHHASTVASHRRLNTTTPPNPKPNTTT